MALAAAVAAVGIAVTRKSRTRTPRDPHPGPGQSRMIPRGPPMILHLLPQPLQAVRYRENHIDIPRNWDS